MLAKAGSVRYVGVAARVARIASRCAGVPGRRACKYHPSCSQYAIDALHEHGLFKGSALAGWRLLRCNPWSRGGVDYAHDQTLFR